MSPLRARLIEAGLIRPWTKELPPIQLAPGTVVFRQEPSWFKTDDSAVAVLVKQSTDALALIHSRRPWRVWSGRHVAEVAQ